MENTNQTNDSNIDNTPNQGTEAAGQGSPAAVSNGRVGRWVKRSVYGFAGLTVLALAITVISPETAVAVSQYLPKEYQETIFATAGGDTCSAGMPVGSYQGSCPSMGSCGSGAPSCCSMSPAAASPEMAAGDNLAADMPSLSLDTMLAGISDD